MFESDQLPEYGRPLRAPYFINFEQTTEQIFRYLFAKFLSNFKSVRFSYSE